MRNRESSPENSLHRENERIPLTLLSGKGLFRGTASVPVTLLRLRGDETKRAGTPPHTGTPQPRPAPSPPQTATRPRSHRPHFSPSAPPPSRSGSRNASPAGLPAPGRHGAARTEPRGGGRAARGPASALPPSWRARLPLRHRAGSYRRSARPAAPARHRSLSAAHRAELRAHPLRPSGFPLARCWSHPRPPAPQRHDKGVEIFVTLEGAACLRPLPEEPLTLLSQNRVQAAQPRGKTSREGPAQATRRQAGPREPAMARPHLGGRHIRCYGKGRGARRSERKRRSKTLRDCRLVAN